MIEPPFTGPVRQIYFDINGTDDFLGPQIIIDETPLHRMIDRCQELLPESEGSKSNFVFSKSSSGFDSLDVLKRYGDTVANTPEYKSGPVIAYMCGCQCEGCWDSYVTIKQTESHIHWYNLQIGSMESKPLENFGILTFDREQYAKECKRLKHAVLKRVLTRISKDALKLEESHLRHEIRSSKHQLDHLLHPDFIEIGSSGNTYTKSQVLESLPSQDHPKFEILEFQASPIDPPTPYSYSTHTNYTLQTTYPDGTVTRTRRSSVWVQEQGNWQLKFHQGTPTPDG